MTWLDYDFLSYELFPQVFNMSMTASIIIVAILIVRLLFRKAPRIFSYVLWIFALFRLLCPISIESEFSLLNSLDVPITKEGFIEYVPQNIVHMENPYVDFSVPLVGEAVTDSINNRLPQGREQLDADPLEFPISTATILWLSGILGLIAYSLIQLLHLRQQLLGATPMDNTIVNKNIFLADYIYMPFVIGFFSPKIYLPSSLPEKEKCFVIMHEKHHIRRGDHVFRVLAFSALCIHWFNPLVWLAFALSAKDMEMSCDEAVMRKMNLDIRAEYSEALLRFASGKRVLLGTPLAFGESDTKARVKNVMKYRRPLLWVSIVACMTLIIVTLLLITNPTLKSTELFGANYKVKQVLYNVTEDEITLQSTEELSYCITADFSLYVQYGKGANWRYLGSMESCSLDKETVITGTIDEGWQTSYNMKNITDAYYLLRSDQNKLYIALQTKSGDTLLCCGQMKMFHDNLRQHEIEYFDYILQLESTLRDGGFQVNFFARTLKHVSNTNVNPFAYWQNDNMPGYVIIGFVADELEKTQQDMRDMGFAVFQTNNGTGYKLLDYHIYKDAALTENGIFMAPDPVVCDLNGNITDKSAYDVIFKTRNSKLASIVRVLDNGTELKRSHVLEGSLDMILFHWADQADSERIKQYYYDAAGNIIEDTGVTIP